MQNGKTGLVACIALDFQGSSLFLFEYFDPRKKLEGCPHFSPKIYIY